MQFNLDKAATLSIRSYAPGELQVGEHRLTAPVILTPEAMHAGWEPPAIGALSIDDFAMALQYTPEVLLFGTGRRQQFPPLALITAIMRTGVGFEVMHTAAACRTFNVLAGEGRRVAAALLLD